MIKLSNITKTYKTGPAGVQAVRDLSLTIQPGEFVALMGPSGSGKSTLLHMMGCLDRPDSGSYKLGSTEITDLSDSKLALLRNRFFGFVFQQFHLLARVSALENTELPLIYAGKRDLKKKAREKIEEVGLADRAGHRPNELSGGQQQRVAIARSLVNDPVVILADEPTGNLDSVSEEEIIGILKKLNDEGKTVIMVTHEPSIAQHARRIISMRDGKVVSDERIAPERESVPAQSCDAGELLDESHQAVGRAEFWDHLRQAIFSVVSHKMRSLLSMLGILIGVAAVIAMLALGQGATESMTEQLSSLGSNLLTIVPGAQQRGGVQSETGKVTRMTLQDATALTELTSVVRRVSPSVYGRVQVVYGNKNWSTSLYATGVDYAPMRSFVPKIGRFFSESELRRRAKVAVIGTTVLKELYGQTNPVGSTIKINRVGFQVIGILPEKGASGWEDQDDVVIIPVTTGMYRVLGSKYVQFIDVEVRNPDLMEEAKESVRKVLNKRHRLDEDDEEAFKVYDMAEIQAMLKSTTVIMSILLGVIAAISLLVGGIGIMNIMLVSVTERTREIGLRKALGARRVDIMVQFLIEAVVMTIIGGAFGIAIGLGITLVLSLLAGWTTKISISSVLLATVFSVVVGVVFGIWPARKAAKLNPIEALRYE